MFPSRRNGSNFKATKNHEAETWKSEPTYFSPELELVRALFRGEVKEMEGGG